MRSTTNSDKINPHAVRRAVRLKLALQRMLLTKRGLWWQYVKAELPPFVILFIVSAIVLVIGFSVRHAVQSADELDARYARSGAQTGGRVLRIRTNFEGPAGEKVPRHYVEYEFVDLGGVKRRGNSSISETQFKSLKRGDSIAVDYLRDEPDLNRVAGQTARSTPAWLGVGFIGVGTLICLLSVAGLGHHSLRAHRRARVVRNGFPYRGWIEQIDEHPQQGGSSRYVLSFKFRDGDGDIYDGWIWMPWRLRDRWQPGAPILVLWDGTPTSAPEPDIFESRGDELNCLAGSAAADSEHRGKRRRRSK